MFMCLSNVFDHQGGGCRMVYPPPHDGNVWEICILNQGFRCIIKFELTSIVQCS